MVKSISILGSTGSVGRQTAAVAEHIGMPVAALTAQSSIKLLEEQARRLHPKFVAVYDEESAKLFKIAVADTDIRVGSGMEGLIEAAVTEESDCVVTGVSGSIGLKPTLAAIDAKKTHCPCEQGNARMRGRNSHEARRGKGRGDSSSRFGTFGNFSVSYR